MQIILQLIIILNYLGTNFSESQHNSNKRNKIFETSIYGIQTVKPRPIKSMAALLKAV